VPPLRGARGDRPGPTQKIADGSASPDPSRDGGDDPDRHALRLNRKLCTEFVYGDDHRGARPELDSVLVKSTEDRSRAPRRRLQAGTPRRSRKRSTRSPCLLVPRSPTVLERDRDSAFSWKSWCAPPGVGSRSGRASGGFPCRPRCRSPSRDPGLSGRHTVPSSSAAGGSNRVTALVADLRGVRRARVRRPPAPGRRPTTRVRATRRPRSSGRSRTRSASGAGFNDQLSGDPSAAGHAYRMVQLLDSMRRAGPRLAQYGLFFPRCRWLGPRSS
jgi:hypothetical protein